MGGEAVPSPRDEEAGEGSESDHIETEAGEAYEAFAKRYKEEEAIFLESADPRNEAQYMRDPPNNTWPVWPCGLAHIDEKTGGSVCLLEGRYHRKNPHTYHVGADKDNYWAKRV